MNITSLSCQNLLVSHRLVLTFETTHVILNNLFVATTIFFTLLWLLNPSILSFVSIFGLTITICDYVVPIISRSLFKSGIWTDAEEKEYEDICTSIVLYKSKARLAIDSYFLLRTTKPKLVRKIKNERIS